MRLVPIITAVLVSAFLYFMVFERETLMEFTGSLGGSTTESDTSQVLPAAEDENASEATSAVRVIARHSTSQVIDSAVILRGETRAMRQVDTKAETSGQIVSEPLRKGAFIEKDQILCEIDKGTREISFAEAQARLAEARSRIPETEARVPEAEARVQEALARLSEAQINANAAEKLAAGGFASETRVANAQAGVSSAEAALKSAEAGLKSAQASMDNVRASIQSAEASVASAAREIEKLTIRAPFAGHLESDVAEIGSLMQPGSLCATIIQLDPIKIVGFAPETSVNRIQEGAMAGARLLDGTTVQGLVSFLSRSADPATRTFLVEIEVPNTDLTIRDGQTAEILIAAEGLPAHLVPQSALTLNNEGDLGVRTITAENEALFSGVTLLRDTAQGVWLGGLPEEVDIILVGQEFVTDGVKVLPSYEEILQ